MVVSIRLILYFISVRHHQKTLYAICSKDADVKKDDGCQKRLVLWNQAFCVGVFSFNIIELDDLRSYIQLVQEQRGHFSLPEFLDGQFGIRLHRQFLLLAAVFPY